MSSQRNIKENIRQSTGQWDGIVRNPEYFTPALVVHWTMGSIYQQSCIIVQNYKGSYNPKNQMQWKRNVYSPNCDMCKLVGYSADQYVSQY